jgi:AraC-like DNA-binding protein
VLINKSVGKLIVNLVDRYKVTASFGRILPKYCNDLGINFKPIAKKFGIEENEFHKSDSYISLISLGEIFEYLAQQTADDTFGLKYSLHFRPGESGPYGFGLMNAPDMRHAIRFMARYISIIVDSIDFKFIEDPNRCRVEWTYSPLFVAKDQYIDLVMRLVIFYLRQFAKSNWKPTAVYLQRDRPKSTQLHLLHISPNLKFNADRNIIELSYAELSNSNPSADHRLFEIMDNQCASKIENRLQAVPLELQIKEKILSNLGSGGILLVNLASQLGITVRSLQRRLAENETHFEGVVDEVRQEHAKQLLLHSKLTQSEIATKLGFSTPSSYSRTAKRWREAVHASYQ